jgi:hypothetical protein
MAACVQVMFKSDISTENFFSYAGIMNHFYKTFCVDERPIRPLKSMFDSWRGLANLMNIWHGKILYKDKHNTSVSALWPENHDCIISNAVATTNAILHHAKNNLEHIVCDSKVCTSSDDDVLDVRWGIQVHTQFCESNLKKKIEKFQTLNGYNRIMATYVYILLQCESWIVTQTQVSLTQPSPIENCVSAKEIHSIVEKMIGSFY